MGILVTATVQVIYDESLKPGGGSKKEGGGTWKQQGFVAVRMCVWVGGG